MSTEKFNHRDITGITKGEKRIERVTVEWLIDEWPDLSWLDQYEHSTDLEEQKQYEIDQERKASYGERWEMVGCRALAHCSIGVSTGVARIEKFTSGGLWGIESDSDENYKASVEGEQLTELRNYLETLGFDTANFDEVIEQQ